jgi:hypothetical protein
MFANPLGWWLSPGAAAALTGSVAVPVAALIVAVTALAVAVMGMAALVYCAVDPPSTTKAAPVANDESSEARKSAMRAISSGCASRSIGLARAI